MLAVAATRRRRVVPSPEPREILGLAAVTRLAAEGMVVVRAGGGAPAVRRRDRLAGAPS